MTARVNLRDIVSDTDRDAALRVRRGAGQDRFVASVEESFADAIRDVRACPRRHQRRGYGTGALDAIVEYLRDRPGAEALFTSAAQGDGSPQAFYERFGFVATDRIVDDEVVLRLDLRGRGSSASRP